MTDSPRTTEAINEGAPVTTARDTYEDGTPISPIMRFFVYGHLPAPLQDVSAPIADLAEKMDQLLPASAEKSAGLRKLLEAKDAFVRAAL